MILEIPKFNRATYYKRISCLQAHIGHGILVSAQPFGDTGELDRFAGKIHNIPIPLVDKVLDNLLPPRRLRTNARTVKRAISKYNARGPNIDRHTYQATITITILAGPT